MKTTVGQRTGRIKNWILRCWLRADIRPEPTRALPCLAMCGMRFFSGSRYASRQVGNSDSGEGTRLLAGAEFGL